MQVIEQFSIKSTCNLNTSELSKVKTDTNYIGNANINACTCISGTQKMAYVTVDSNNKITSNPTITKRNPLINSIPVYYCN
jgi:hypothetical protein